MKGERTLLWFRNDLRVQDNRALDWAARNSTCVLPLFIFHDQDNSPGEASKWWLHHALQSLGKSLHDMGSKLFFFRGVPLEIIAVLCDAYEITVVVWNREYEPSTIQRDTAIKAYLEKRGITVQSFSGNVLKEPWKETKKDGSPYRVFTPFWKSLQPELEIPDPLPAPSSFPSLPSQALSRKELASPELKEATIALDSACLLPRISWDSEFDTWWPDVSESGAHGRLQEVIRAKIHLHYEEARNFPAVEGTSLLSPYLRWGQITPQRVWWELSRATGAKPERVEPLLRQLGWRDFAHALLFHFPHSVTDPLNETFKGFDWLEADRGEPASHLKAWQRGTTGYPIVDAGMRQLWATGWMHNRVRMIVGSFLVKHLLIHWHHGFAWFWDTLVDADLANNTMGWQWIAGCGADAAPYFRIFNPMSQGEKFDPEGKYVSEWVPELSRVPVKYIHRPWEAPEMVLRGAGVRLGQEYAGPIISHEEGRKRALRVYGMMRL